MAQNLQKPQNSVIPPHRRVYALYKGDLNVCDGTIAQIAKRMGVKPDTIRFYGTPTYQKRNTGENFYSLVLIEED